MGVAPSQMEGIVQEEVPVTQNSTLTNDAVSCITSSPRSVREPSRFEVHPRGSQSAIRPPTMDAPSPALGRASAGLKGSRQRQFNPHQILSTRRRGQFIENGTPHPDAGFHVSRDEDLCHNSCPCSMISSQTMQRPNGVPTRPTSDPTVRLSSRGSNPQPHHGSLISIGNSMRTVEEVKKAFDVITAESKNDESLPAPWHETQMKISQYLSKEEKKTTVPMEFPKRPQSSCVSDPVALSNDIEYLEQLYNIRTWNMHKLISSARQVHTHTPSIVPYCYDYHQGYAHTAVHDSNDLIFEME